MGLVAPVAAVLGAAIPTLVTAFAEGFPGYRHVFGFILAGVGVWLISRTEAGVGRPEGLGMAVLAGIGFAGFYLCIHQAGNGSALWIATCSRFGALLVTGAIVLFGRHLRAVAAPVLGIAVVAGILDISGTAVFIRASSNWTPGRRGRAQFALSRGYRFAGSHFSARALQPRPDHRHGGGAGGGADDCGVRGLQSVFHIPEYGMQLTTHTTDCRKKVICASG